MANIKPWEEASKAPAYLNASPEQQAQMREQYKAAGGSIPEEQPVAQPQQEERGVIGEFAQGVSNALQSGGANIAASAAKGIGGLVEIGENLAGAQTSYGKRIQENSQNLLKERMDKIEDGIGKTAGQYAGVVGDIGLTVANPLAAAAIIAGRETGRAYADQTPEEGEDKSVLDAALVGGANYAAQRILPGAVGTAESTLGRIGQNVASNAVAGAKGGALVGAAEAQNKHGDDTTFANVLEGAIEEGAMGAAFGGAVGGVHGLISRPDSTVFKNTPEYAKTDIAADDELIRSAKNVDELKEAYSKAETANAASALNLLDENGFRITDAVAVDSPAAQRILNTDQARAEKAASAQKEHSNIPGLNPLASPAKVRGKAFADNEHNQKQAVAMKDAMADYTKDNTKALTDVLDNLDRELTSLRASGHFTGSPLDVKNRTQADRDFIDAYKTFYNEANRFKARDGEDFNNFVEKAAELQKMADNVSPEMKKAIGGLKKLKGMPEGFNPIQDAYTLNNTAKFMSNQDRGWTSLTDDGFRETSSPSLVMNTLGAAKYAINRFSSQRARSQRVKQQEANSEAIRSLARGDLEVARAKSTADEARAKMEEEPVVDDIKFKTQNDVETEPVREPSSSTVTEENLPSSAPQESPLTARDLVAQRRAIRQAEQRRAEEEAAAAQEAPVEQAPQAEPLPARNPLEERRAMEQQRAQEEAAQAPEPTVEEPTAKAEPLPARAPKAPEEAVQDVKPESGIEYLAAMSSTARQVARDRATRFAKSLYSKAAKAKATAENFLAYKGDPLELMRRIRREDNAINTERHEEMARNQLASQQGIATAKNNTVRTNFAEWVKERGLPEDIATKALRAEEKGLGGNVTNLDSLKRRAERLYQKQREDEFDRLYQEALEENKAFDKKDAPKLVDQKKELQSEIDTLIDSEPLRPAQKDAMRKLMNDYVDGKFKSSEKAGREEALEVGQMKDVWDGFINTYNREVNAFNKANKNSQYEAAAKHLQAREERLATLRNKAQARSDAKAAVENERKTLEAIAAQKSEIEKMMEGLPKPVREAQESRTLKQLAAHHDKNSPVPPEKFRSYIERIHNAESDYLDRQRRLTDAEEDARQAKWNKMYEQAEEMDRKFDIDKRVKRSEELKAAQKRENDLMAVQRQRDDIHRRLMHTLEDKGISKEDAEAFAGSYMDNRYALLDKPMTPTEHQNARSRIEADVEKFAKKYESMTPIEKEIVKITGDTEGKLDNLDADTRKAVEEAQKVDSDIKKLQEEELEMEKIRSALPDDEKSQANSDILESIKQQEEVFADKVEKAFLSGKSLDELASVAEVLDRVHGADKAGNNRRFVRALQTAAENKKKYGDNPVAWFSADDYSAIAKLGASSAGGNKSRALEKIFGSTAEQAKSKLLGRDDVAKMRRVIEENPDVKIPSYKTTNRTEYLQFLEKFNDEGKPKIKRGSLSEKLERSKRQSRLRVRVRPKE
ncbi:erythrocyte binding protein 1 [Escherichia phage 172-1]|uniref:Erythrocyte binding protein 1 n=1 Tax=Escherichia phage 172-1 TaxID=1598146 RepID=A0A0D5BHG2_9CAUD|nr:erythrocyte binding protein 1 [Escherichia phage 172-1]AJW61407.1 erythrocyte binding protein 1 [Escherichia phage 172-1]